MRCHFSRSSRDVQVFAISSHMAAFLRNSSEADIGRCQLYTRSHPPARPVMQNNILLLWQVPRCELAYQLTARVLRPGVPNQYCRHSFRGIRRSACGTKRTRRTRGLMSAYRGEPDSARTRSQRPLMTQHGHPASSSQQRCFVSLPLADEHRQRAIPWEERAEPSSFEVGTMAGLAPAVCSLLNTSELGARELRRPYPLDLGNAFTALCLLGKFGPRLCHVQKLTSLDCICDFFRGSHAL
jgi:hypothetical protein